MTDSKSSPQPRSPAWSNALIVTLWAVAVVGALCLPVAATRALWTDELYSLTTAEESLPRMIRLLADYHPGYWDHPPLYFMMLHSVLTVGNAPILVRGLSLLSVMIVGVAWGLFLLRRGLPLPLCLAVILALVSHPTVAFETINVRMYAPLMAITTLAIVAAVDLAESDRWKWIVIFGLAVLIGMGVYTSYFGILFAGGMGLFALLVISRATGFKADRWRGGGSILAACVVGALIVAPWVPVILKMIGAENSGAPAPMPRSQQVINLLFDLTGGKVAAAPVLLGAVALAIWGREKKLWLSLLIAFVAAPVAILCVVSPISRPVALRYVIFAVPVLFACSAVGWHSVATRVIGSKRWPAAVACVALIIAVPFQQWTLHRTFFRPVPDWWAVAAILEAHAGPNETILTGGYLSGEALYYHLDAPSRFSFIHYVTDHSEFRAHCASPNVGWYVNAAPLPQAYADVADHAFTHRLVIEGNAGLEPIQVYAKEPFFVEWRGEMLTAETLTR